MFCELQEHDILVTVSSNINSEPACQISKLRFSRTTNCNVDDIQFQSLGWLLEQRKCEMTLPLPKLLQYKISSGDDLHCSMYEPPNLDEKKLYPVVLDIYGGPDFQHVTNKFKVCTRASAKSEL